MGIDPCLHTVTALSSPREEGLATQSDPGRRYFCSHMTQPKFQLDTFKAWAGKSSDISYYLNSHHIDIHCWAMA